MNEQPMSSTDPKIFQERLLSCLGGPWPDPCDLKPNVTGTEQHNGFQLQAVTYQAEPGDIVPAYLLIPDGINATNPAPAIAVWHQHNGQWHLGKSEPAGLAGDPMHHTGVRLVEQGYVVLCPDALCFEQRRDRDKRLLNQQYEFYQFLHYVVAGRSMAWKNILDMQRAVDYLVSRSEVDPIRVGCFGHSMGSTHTWLVGPWEPRLMALVGNCCLPTYAAIERTRIIHCCPNFIPGLARYGDTPDIAALIAPRALHLNFGEEDTGSPLPEVRQAIDTIANAYKRADAIDRFTSYVEPNSGHVLSEQMWSQALNTFKKYL